jgi:hypothetical protein
LDALFQIGPLKAGFPARFYQRNWDILKNDVITAVRHFFRTSFMPEGTNGNSIVLIPKIDNPSDLKDYHPIGLPIGLCNVLYKVASKCLVNRMRPFFR